MGELGRWKDRGRYAVQPWWRWLIAGAMVVLPLVGVTNWMHVTPFQVFIILLWLVGAYLVVRPSAKMSP